MKINGINKIVNYKFLENSNKKAHPLKVYYLSRTIGGGEGGGNAPFFLCLHTFEVQLLSKIKLTKIFFVRLSIFRPHKIQAFLKVSLKRARVSFSRHIAKIVKTPFKPKKQNKFNDVIFPSYTALAYLLRSVLISTDR